MDKIDVNHAMMHKNGTIWKSIMESARFFHKIETYVVEKRGLNIVQKTGQKRIRGVSDKI